MSIEYFLSNTLLNILKKNTDISGSSANYIYSGLLINNDITNGTFYNGNLVNKITKKVGVVPADISSNNFRHIMNMVHIQDPSWWTHSPSTIETHIEKIKRWSLVSIDISSNLSQFKIFEQTLEANSINETLVYKIGTPNNYAEVDVDINKGLFDISRNNRIDAYAREGYDRSNMGYWYTEKIQYFINFSSIQQRDISSAKPLKYELRSYYNETGKGEVNTNYLGKTNILHNSANDPSFVYFDDLSALPNILKNGADMINYTTNNKINGIPNLHMINSNKSFSISLKYKVNNYSTRFLLDKSIPIIQHFFSYSPSTILKDISWNAYTSVAPSITTNGYKREVDYWDVDGLVISTAPLKSDAISGIQLKINAQNTMGPVENFKTIGSSDSEVYKFIYDKPSITEFNDISNSLCEVPSGFKPDYGVSQTTGTSSVVPGSYTAFGDNSNNLQMSLWDGKFYSNYGWQNASIISSNADIISHKISNIPTFLGSNDEYKWVIFKYTCTKNYTNAYILTLGFSDNSTDIGLSNIVNKDVKIFINFNRLDTYNGNGTYYWFDIGKKGDITPSNANNKAYNYEGALRFTPNDNESEINFISGVSVKNDFLPGVSNPILNGYNRLIGSYFNGINTNSNKTIFAAIGIKNDKNFYIKKPHLWLADGNTNAAFQKLE